MPVSMYTRATLAEVESVKTLLACCDELENKLELINTIDQPWKTMLNIFFTIEDISQLKSIFMVYGTSTLPEWPSFLS